ADRGRMILGEVEGTRPTPYSTLVTHAGDGPRGPQWVSRCSCPVATRCKHAVALVLQARSDSHATGGAGRSWAEVLDEVLPEVDSGGWTSRARGGAVRRRECRAGLGCRATRVRGPRRAATPQHLRPHPPGHGRPRAAQGV